MKIVRDSLKQTSVTCPSAWVGLTDDGSPLEISFRTGRLVLSLEGRVSLTTDRDQFDVSSYITLDEALSVLKEKEGVEAV
jgi:hypothetical protein